MIPGEGTPQVGQEESIRTGQRMVSLPSDQGEGKRKLTHESSMLNEPVFGVEDVKRNLHQRGDRAAKGSRAGGGLRGAKAIPVARKISGFPPANTTTYITDERRQSQSLAQKLLSLCKCSRCERIITDPVTLPCSHSACLSCIMIMTSASSSTSATRILPSTSLLPPRLPLSATTVPCPVSGCPRSAIGQGMGIWSGHKAIYGTDQHNEMLELPAAVESSGNDTEAGPMDGFVAPQNQESNRLVVIPAQSRSTFTSEYAISKYALKSVSMSDESGLLRPDVTLSKALELLMQYALIPSDSSGSVLMKKQSARISPRAETTVRHRRSRRSRVLRRDNSDVSSSSYTALHHPAGSRTEINPHFLTALGVSEKGLDTGAIGGIRATLDSDTEEDEVPAVESRTVRGWDAEDDEDANDWTNSEDDHDEEIGGAFARHYGSPTPTPGEKDSPTAKTITIPPSKSTAPAILTPETLHCALLDVLECQLCYMLLYQPLTTPCGHTFCRQCFARSLDHSSSCPLCRADMPSFSFFQSHPSNEIILKLLTATWEESGETEDISMSPSPSKPSAEQQQQHLGLKLLYQERQISVDKEARESLLSTPLFVCTLAFPHMPTILHIFEPRYRLMIRRCLESGFARFGMVLHSTDTTGPVPGMSRYGTMLEIKTVQMLPDGRSMIETVGSHRFRVLERGSLDGYTVGQIERIDDVLPEQEDQAERAALGMVDPNSPPSILAEAREAQAAFQAAIGVDFSRGEEQRQEQAVNILDNFAQRNTDQLVAVCTDFIETLQSGSAPWLMTRLNNTYGPMPEATNVAAFGYWMALVMPIDEHEKAKLLPIRSPRLRLRIVVHWIEQLRQTWWFNNGCSVQ